jgi:phosphatidylglycerophosphate synthase
MHLKPMLGWLGVLLTLLKLLICWTILSLIINAQNSLASVGIFCLMISDILDGIIFRKSTPEIQRQFGLVRRVMDAVGDRICICLVFLAMIQETDLPLYIYGVELAREVSLISIIGYSWATARPIKEPNLPSRIATFLLGLTAIAWLNTWANLSIILINFVALIGALGLWRYYQSARYTDTN